MKKLILLLGMLVAANLVFAQDEPVEPDPKRAEKIKEQLDLTDEQAEQLRKLREKYRPEVQQIRQDESLTQAERMRAMADIIEQRQAEMSTILNAQQMEQMQRMRKKRRQHNSRRRAVKMRERRDRPRGGR